MSDQPVLGEEVGRPQASVAPVTADGQRVLVVDGEPRVAAMLKELLDAAAYRVEVCTDGRGALERLTTGSYDAVLADVHLPGMDGMALYQAASGRRPELRGRFVFMTADAWSPLVAGLLRTGEVSCLTKPFVIAELAAAVRRVTGRP